VKWRSEPKHSRPGKSIALAPQRLQDFWWEGAGVRGADVKLLVGGGAAEEAAWRGGCGGGVAPSSEARLLSHVKSICGWVPEPELDDDGVAGGVREAPPVRSGVGAAARAATASGPPSKASRTRSGA
jgi:hypothetical protein